jgi:hypothetical protein
MVKIICFPFFFGVYTIQFLLGSFFPLFLVLDDGKMRKLRHKQTEEKEFCFEFRDCANTTEEIFQDRVNKFRLRVQFCFAFIVDGSVESWLRIFQFQLFSVESKFSEIQFSNVCRRLLFSSIFFYEMIQVRKKK